MNTGLTVRMFTTTMFTVAKNYGLNVPNTQSRNLFNKSQFIYIVNFMKQLLHI